MTAESGFQLYMQSLEKNISDMMRSEVENGAASGEAKVQAAILSAMENLVVPRLELALRSADIYSTRNPDSVVLDPYQRDFSGDTSDLQMTASRRYNSNINLDRIDGTRGIITVEEVICWLVKEISTGKHTIHTNHSTHFWVREKFPVQMQLPFYFFPIPIYSKFWTKVEFFDGVTLCH